MTSVNTNIAAMTALRNLQTTNSSMEVTQNRISTGLKINSAKDNAAYWAIATTLKSDDKSLSTVKDALGLGSSTVDTAYQGLTKAKDVLDELKSKLTAATQDGVDRDTIQQEIGQLQNQLKSIATSSVFSGENWLSVDTSAVSYNANKQVVASFARDAAGSVSIGTIAVDISRVALFDASTAANTGGIVDGAINLKGKDGRDLSIGGTDVTSGNQNKVGLDAAATATNTTWGAATASTGNNTSVVGGAVAANTLTGPTAVAPYTAATAAKESLTGTFTPVNLDDNDAITLVFRQDGDSSDRTVTINKASTAGGLGAIATVDDLVAAANTALTAGSHSGVKAIKDATTGAFTLQRWDPAANSGAGGALLGLTKSVNIISWTGVDPTLASPVSITGSATNVTGQTATAAVKTFQFTGTAGATASLAFDLDGGASTYPSVTVNVTNGDTAATIASNFVAQINGNPATFAGAHAAIKSGTTDTIELTFQATGVATVPTITGTVTGVTVGTVGGTLGNADAKASSSVTLGTFGSAVTLDGDDKLTFTFADGATSRTVEITRADVTGTATAGVIASNAEFRTALNNALTRQGLSSNYAVTLTGSTLKVEAPVATASQAITIAPLTAIGTVDTDSLSAKAHGLSAPSGAATFGTDVAKGFTSTTLVGGTGGTLALAAGDTITVNYMLDGTAGSKTLTVGAGTFDAAAFKTAWDAATPATPGVVLTNTSGTLKFESQLTSSTGVFTLVDATVNSSAATGSRIKNVDVLAGLTSSKAASVKTAALTWTGLVTADKVTVNLSADGQALAPVTVAAGTSVDDFVANLNANTTFNAKLVASKTSGGELLLTSKTTGTASTASLTNVSFANADGSAKNVSGTGFGSVVSAATASTAAFTSAVTLDDDDNLYFRVQIDQATAPTNVTINKALVNKALATASNPVTNGTISSAADFKTVVDAALAQANVKGVTTAVNGSNQLVFTSSTVGANSKVLVSDVVASQGGDKISLENLDISAAGLSKVGATSSDQIKQVLTAYIDAVNTAIGKVTSAAASLGSVASRIDLQKNFVNTLMDTIDKGVGNLVDADMSEESTKLQALQTKQQLGIQALSIANQSAQSILSLFRG